MRSRSAKPEPNKGCNVGSAVGCYGKAGVKSVVDVVFDGLIGPLPSDSFRRDSLILYYGDPANSASEAMCRASESLCSQTVDDVRTAVIARAEQALADNEPYGLYDRSGNFPPGSYKCNKFVCDVANAAGARVPLNVDEHGNAWPPLAGTLGNPNVKIPGWVVVTDPQPGDIVAQQRGYGDASGHSGIIVNSDLDVISAREGGVSKDPLKIVFPDNYRGDDFQKGPIVFRRYIGGN
jgi:hypothetical protein